jgi:hypothetical protein
MTCLKTLSFLFLLLFFSSPLFSQNILISDQGNPSEPSIMMDPENPEKLVAGAVLNHVYISSDTGKTWTRKTLTSTYGVWGDPVIDVDTNGHFYYFHLANPPNGNWIDRIVCQKSTDGGTNWSPGTYMGLNGAKAQDKHWSIVDRNKNSIYVTWTQFDDYGSSSPSDSSLILFSKSLDGGQSWSEALRINQKAGDCIDKDNTVEGAVPALGPNGEIYVSWAGPAGIRFDRSLDEGETWLEEDILVDPMPGGWDFNVPDIYRCNGLPVTKCDISGGPHQGTIYINWTDQRNGSNDTDVWLSKSTDGGDSWSAPVRVNDDGPGKHQFFTWMDIDQTTGYLFFVYYDRRAYNDSRTDVYMAISTDGGETFFNKKISESPFFPNSGIFFGDYNNIVAHKGIVRPIWTRLHNGQLSIWTDVTPLDSMFVVDTERPDVLELDIFQYPNPVSDISYVSFKLKKAATVSLFLTDVNGKVVHSLIDNERRDYGRYVLPVNLKQLHLAPGNYFYQLEVDGRKESLKMVVVD